MKEVYILEEYEFYDGSKIVLVSENYAKVKKCFEKLVKGSETGKGYVIRKYEYDKEYLAWNEDGESLDWIEIDYNRNIKDFKEI